MILILHCYVFPADVLRYSVLLSIACIYGFLLASYIVTVSVKCVALHGDTRLLKLPCPWNPGQGHSRSSKLTPFDSLRMVSYYRPIVTLCLKCTVFEIWRHNWSKIAEKTYPTLIWHVPLGWPLANFSTTHVLPETRIMRLSDGVHFTICFRCARHNTGVWRTDVRTDRRTDGHVLSQRPR